MTAVQDQVQDNDVRIFRRYGIRAFNGLEQPQEEVVTYVRSEDELHNYTIELPEEEGFWLIASIANPFSVSANYEGHTKIYQVPPHLVPPSKDITLVDRKRYDALLAEIDQRIEAERVQQQEVLKEHLVQRNDAKEKLIESLKKGDQIDTSALAAFLEQI